ncbi:MAG: hypothetical protein WC705_03380 [Candidatus Paceibacterota bacterium]|jgi:hypothetical protein
MPVNKSSEKPFINEGFGDSYEFSSPDQKLAELFFESREFLGTFGSSVVDKKEAERMAKAYGGVVKDFGVDIESIDTKTNKVTEWKKDKGFSVWK